MKFVKRIGRTQRVIKVFSHVSKTGRLLHIVILGMTWINATIFHFLCSPRENKPFSTIVNPVISKSSKGLNFISKNQTEKLNKNVVNCWCRHTRNTNFKLVWKARKFRCVSLRSRCVGQKARQITRVYILINTKFRWTKKLK